MYEYLNLLNTHCVISNRKVILTAYCQELAEALVEFMNVTDMEMPSAQILSFRRKKCATLKNL